jgi:tetratricopeptide (TPR) repeat protein
MLAMYRGQYADAIEQFRMAAVLHHADRATVSEFRSRLFLAAAEGEKGWRDSVDHELRAAYGLFTTSYLEPSFLFTLGKHLATHGDVRRAREVLDSLARRARPENTRDRSDHLALQGEIALAEGRADSAVRLMTLACVADSSAWKEESLARSLVATGNLPAAALVYQKLAGQPDRWYGWEPEPYGLTASLQAGRLYAQLGNTAQARVEYERMLNQWRHGDSDLVDLRETRRLLETLATARRTAR